MQYAFLGLLIVIVLLMLSILRYLYVMNDTLMKTFSIFYTMLTGGLKKDKDQNATV